MLLDYITTSKQIFNNRDLNISGNMQTTEKFVCKAWITAWKS